MDFLLIALAIIGGIAAAISETKKNRKHKEVSKLKFSELKDFKADNFYLFDSSGLSIGFDIQRKKICILDAANKP